MVPVPVLVSRCQCRFYFETDVGACLKGADAGAGAGLIFETVARACLNCAGAGPGPGLLLKLVPVTVPVSV